MRLIHAEGLAFIHAARLGHALAPCGARRLRVSLPAAALPTPPPDASAFAGGGRVIGARCGCRGVPLALAWAANLIVLLAGVMFVVYGFLFAFPDGGDGAAAAAANGTAVGGAELAAFKAERLTRFRTELFSSFLLSLLLSWGVKDLAAPLVIACLPLQSSRGRLVAQCLTGALGMLSP